MGIIDKVKFWKGDDLDLDLDEELPPIESNDDFRFEDSTNKQSEGSYDWNKRDRPNMNQMQQEGFQNMPQGTTGDIQKDLDLISSKLDTIKAELDGMDQRIRKIERIAEGEQAGQKGGKTRASRDPWSNY